jgi:Type IV secretory pathway, VirJ component
MGVALAGIPVVVGSQVAVSQDDLSRLPLTEMRATPDSSNVLVIFLTGDGGWASIDKQVTAEIRAHGVDVVGLNTRPYLGKKKTPAEIAFDLTRIARHYMTAWNRSRLAIVGYSRGADLMPFGVVGMPADLRDKTVLLGFLGLATRVGFEFHFADIMFSIKRDSDQPTLPTLAQLKGMKMLCIYGAEEENSGCRAAPPGLITRTVQLPGRASLRQRLQACR